MKNLTKTKIKYGLFFTLHNLIPYLAFVGLLIYSFVQAESKEKAVIGVSCICLLILAAIAIFSHKNMDCIKWILITLIYVGVQDIFLVPLTIITIYITLDDILFKFLYTKYQTEYRQLRVLYKHDEDVNE